MRQRWQYLAMIVVFSLAITPTEIVAQKKDKKAAQEDYAATPADYAQIKNTKELTGTLQTIDGSSHTLTLRVEVPHYEPNPKYKPTMPKNGPNVNQQAYQLAKMAYEQWKLYQDIMKLQQTAAQAKKPQDVQRAMQRYQNDLARWQLQQIQYTAKMNAAIAQGIALMNNDPNNQPFKVVASLMDYTLEIQDPVVVRKMFLATEYDDTGNLKKYTAQEKEELRGKDKTKPGYEAKFEDLLPSQEVKISLTPPKKKSDKDKEKDKDAKTDDAPMIDDVPRPTVNMIVMTKELTASPGESTPKKDKKK
jgi:hypothetical protein